KLWRIRRGVRRRECECSGRPGAEYAGRLKDNESVDERLAEQCPSESGASFDQERLDSAFFQRSQCFLGRLGLDHLDTCFGQLWRRVCCQEHHTYFSRGSDQLAIERQTGGAIEYDPHVRHSRCRRVTY